MKHVFVETNFIIDVLRPFPAPAAEALANRIGADVTLYMPWVAIAEAKRTLVRLIGEDLGFTEMLAKYAVREFQAGTLSRTDKPVIDALAARAKARLAQDIQSASIRIDALAARAVVIEPTKPVVAKALSLFAVKTLKPFDEMVLAAVLTEAAQLHANGERDLYVCNKNTNDFDPVNRPLLKAEYDACGLTFLATFAVPT